MWGGTGYNLILLEKCLPKQWRKTQFNISSGFENYHSRVFNINSGLFNFALLVHNVGLEKCISQVNANLIQ